MANGNVDHAGRIKQLVSNLESNSYSWQIYIKRNGQEHLNHEYSIDTLSELKSDETAMLQVWRAGKHNVSNVIMATYDMKKTLGYINELKVIATSDEELEDVDGLINQPTGEQLSFF